MEYYINLVYSICVFVIGTLFGSFFTLATYRIPRHQDIVKTRSYCPNCKHRLEFFDCFPILSYVSTIGRCKYCKKPISIRYPLIELATGFSFLIIYLIFGLSLETFILIACYIALFLIIGSSIMKSKMTPEELAEVQEKKNRKKVGAINSDILVAVIAFVIFFIATVAITANYRGIYTEYVRKSDAFNLCLNTINEQKAKNYYDLENIDKTVTVGGMEYNVVVEVLPYMTNGSIEVNNVKVVISTVSYQLKGVTKSVILKSIKVESV